MMAVRGGLLRVGGLWWAPPRRAGLRASSSLVCSAWHSARMLLMNLVCGSRRSSPQGFVTVADWVAGSLGGMAGSTFNQGLSDEVRTRRSSSVSSLYTMRPKLGSALEPIASLWRLDGCATAGGGISPAEFELTTACASAVFRTPVQIVRIVGEVLIPETKRASDVEFVAHLRCISCNVLERLVGYLSRLELHDNMVRCGWRYFCVSLILLWAGDGSGRTVPLALIHGRRARVHAATSGGDGHDVLDRHRSRG